MRIYINLLSALLLLAPFYGTHAVETGETMKEDKKHVNLWNDFANKVYALHKRQMVEQEISTTEKTGGYRDNPKFYREVSYFNKSTGKLLSRIQWETENTKTVHSIEVNVYDKDGDLVRDYGASYLPYHRNAPIQTLINIHNYNKGLHGIRQFDANGDRLYEVCEGNYKGKEVQFRLFEDELSGAYEEADQMMSSPVYDACFRNMAERLGKYSTPQ